MFSQEALLYFWCRHTEGMLVSKSVQKWNKAYPSEPHDELNVGEMLSAVVTDVDAGQDSFKVLHKFLVNQNGWDLAPLGSPVAAVEPVVASRKIFFTPPTLMGRFRRWILNRRGI